MRIAMGSARFEVEPNVTLTEAQWAEVGRDHIATGGVRH